MVALRDGQAALEAAEQSKFDIVLVDIRMPGLSGTDLAPYESNRHFERVPIVAPNPYALLHERDAALHAGFDVVLPKPCLPQALIQTVDALLLSTP